MPLIHSKSKQAFKKNVETEMKSGKPQDQSLAIAYNIKRRNKKKMAEGGTVSASNEARPATSSKANDSASISHNSAKKPVIQSQWTDSPTVKQAQKPSKAPMSQPRIIKGSTFATRTLADQERDLMAMRPESPDHEPSQAMDEEDATKEGANPDMTKPHTTRKAYAKGGMINEEVSMEDAENDEVEHPAGLESDNDEMSPAHSDYMEEHDAAQYAEGGEIQPEPEAEDEQHDSLVAAIMAKRKRMAEGGQVDIDSNAEEQPNRFDARNAEILKENYDSDMDDVRQPTDSNLHSDDIESDMHDMVSKIRAKYAMKKAFR